MRSNLPLYRTYPTARFLIPKLTPEDVMCGIGESLGIRTSLNAELENPSDIRFEWARNSSTKTPLPFITISDGSIDKNLTIAKRTLTLSRNKYNNPLK